MSLRFLPCILLFAVFVAACDGSEDEAFVTINVTLEGEGTGRIEAQTVGVALNCSTRDGTVSGTCSTIFQSPAGGSIVLRGTPDGVTDFRWGGDCRSAAGEDCDLSFTSGEDVTFNVVGRFSAKTVRVVISPNPIIITTAGAAGAVIATAQALDSNDAEIFGVTYTWASMNPAVATVTPQANPRSAVITAVSTGGTTVTAAVQGVTAQTQIDVNLNN